MRQSLIAALAPHLGERLAALVVPGWFGMVGLAALISGSLLLRQAARRGDDVQLVARTAALAYLAAVACGILGPMALDTLEGLAHGQLRVRWAGMTSFCGFLGASAAVWLVLRRRSLSPLAFADRMAVPAGVAIAITRLGCLLAGCDYGTVSGSALALRFPQGSPAFRAHLHAGLLPRHATESLPVHPTQLYEAALGLLLVAIAAALWRSRWARERDGRVFGAVLACYAVGRMVIEMFRGDLGRGVWAGMSSAQIFALAALLALIGFARRQRGQAAALAVAVVMALLPRPAAADESTDDPVPVDPYAPAPAPAPDPPQPDPKPAEPLSPYPAPTPTAPGTDGDPAVATPGTTAPASGPEGSAAGTPGFEVAGFLGGAVPLNRRAGQVPTLAGMSLTAALRWPSRIGVFLDLDSLASGVASHGSAIVGGSLDWRISDTVDAGARVGLGPTLVNFDDPVFDSVLAFGVRLGASVEWAMTPKLALVVRPLSFDYIEAAGLGGPITSYQVRIGLAYRFRTRSTPRVATPSSDASTTGVSAGTGAATPSAAPPRRSPETSSTARPGGPRR